MVAPAQPQQLPLLNNVWKLITHIPHINDYLSSAVVWLEYTAKHFSVSMIFTDIFLFKLIYRNYTVYFVD